MSLHITERSNGSIVITLPTRFDYTLWDDFHQNVLGKTTGSKKPVLCFNFLKTDYMDNVGLAMLLLARKATGGETADVRLTNVWGFPAAVLRLANFQALFDIQWSDTGRPSGVRQTDGGDVSLEPAKVG